MLTIVNKFSLSMLGGDSYIKILNKEQVRDLLKNNNNISFAVRFKEHVEDINKSAGFELIKPEFKSDPVDIKKLDSILSLSSQGFFLITRDER